MSVQSGWSRFPWGQAYWNRDALLATGWGAKAWNDGEYGNLADETISLTGIASTSSVGSLSLAGNAVIEPTGVSATGSTGSISPVIPKTVEVGGVSFQSSVNSITNVIDVITTPSGVSSTGAIGVIDPADQFVGLTSQVVTSSLGTAVAPNEDVSAVSYTHLTLPTKRIV